MRTEDLEAFRAVVAHGGISAGARALGRSQPGVTRQLQRLEQVFGAVLVERGTDGVRTTAAGEQVLNFAAEVLEELGEVRRNLRTVTEPDMPTLHIAASTVPGEYLVPSIVARFADLHPDVRVAVQVQDSAAVVRALLERRADVGFTGSMADDPRLHSTPFASDEVLLAVPQDHPLAKRRHVTPTSLKGERLLVREEGSGTQRTFTEALAAAGMSMEGAVDTISLGSTQAVLLAVDAGLGVGIVSELALARHRPGRIRAVRLRGVRAVRNLWMVYEVSRRRSALHAAFVALAEASAEVPGVVTRVAHQD